MRKVCLHVNGLAHEVVAGPDQVLLDFLRNDLDLIGAKQSCDRKGQCGACTVIVNGRAMRSCLTKVAEPRRGRGDHHRGPGHAPTIPT